MVRGAAFSFGLHVLVVVMLVLDYAFLDSPAEVLSDPIIPVELTTIGPETNQATAGEKTDAPPPPQATAPDSPPPPPPPPPAAAPEPPPLPDTNALVREAPEPPAPEPEPEPEPDVAVAPPAPRPAVEERADKAVAPKEKVVEEAEKLAAREPLPEPKAPEPEPEPEKKAEPKPDPKPEPEKKTAATPPKPAPKPAPEKTEKKGLDLDRLAAKIDRMADERQPPRPREQDRRQLADIRIGEGGVSQNRLNQKLSVSEVDLLRHRLRENWSPNHGAPGVESMQVVISIVLKPDGTLAAPPRVIDGFDAGQSRDVFGAFSDSAVRAVYKSQPLPLPQEKFQDWQEIEINFNLRDMYG